MRIIYMQGRNIVELIKSEETTFTIYLIFLPFLLFLKTTSSYTRSNVQKASCSVKGMFNSSDNCSFLAPFLAALSANSLPKIPQ